MYFICSILSQTGGPLKYGAFCSFCLAFIQAEIKRASIRINMFMQSSASLFTLVPQKWKQSGKGKWLSWGSVWDPGKSGPQGGISILLSFPVLTLSCVSVSLSKAVYLKNAVDFCLCLAKQEQKCSTGFRRVSPTIFAPDFSHEKSCTQDLGLSF